MWKMMFFNNGANVDFWEMADESKEEWWMCHPLRDSILVDTEKWALGRILGDKVALSKTGRSLLALT
ncbi:MAG: hypothetical protein ACKPKO_23155, partial [Candidatus Fonsibacter sp.]